MWQHPHEAITTHQHVILDIQLLLSKDMGRYGETSTKTIAYVNIISNFIQNEVWKLVNDEEIELKGNLL
jgi:hypothetical protein